MKTYEEWEAMHSRWREEERARVSAAMALVPENARAVELRADDSTRRMIVTRCASDPCKWQLTWFTKNGEPWGHDLYKQRDDAIKSAIGVYGSGTYGPPDGDSHMHVVRAR